MMLGSRFSVGSELPRGISAKLASRIREVEASLSAEESATKRWTLTWLENRPIVELDGGVKLEG
jgi:hypothetical protein